MLMLKEQHVFFPSKEPAIVNGYQPGVLIDVSLISHTCCHRNHSKYWSHRIRRNRF